MNSLTEIVPDDVQGARVLREEHHPVAPVLQAAQQPVQHHHLAGRLHNVLYSNNNN